MYFIDVDAQDTFVLSRFTSSESHIGASRIIQLILNFTFVLDRCLNSVDKIIDSVDQMLTAVNVDQLYEYVLTYD